MCDCQTVRPTHDLPRLPCLPQASHDAHTIKIDTLEDRLVNTEIRSANELAHTNAMWSAKRNRDRISEIINYIERNMIELDELAGEEEPVDP